MRSITELQAECAKAGLDTTGLTHRIELMDLLRAELGSFDTTTEIDPMKAADLKGSIDWGITPAEGRYKGIQQYMNSDWVLEPKLDGCRMRLFLGLTGNTMNTGRRSVKTYRYQDRTNNFPHIRDAVVAGFAGTILDGELISSTPQIVTHTGAKTNSLLNASVALCLSNPEDSVRTQAAYGKANFWVFDAMTINGEDVTGLPWTDRRRMLEAVVEGLNVINPGCKIILVPTMEATAENAQLCLEGGFEGAMLKRKAGVYQPGKRSKNWLKVKGFSTGDFFITGSELGKEGNTGKVGSVIFSCYREDGTIFEAGKFGNLTDDLRNQLSMHDGSLNPQFMGRVVEIMAQARTKTDRLRHAHLVQFRPDKEAVDCGWDQLMLFGQA